MSEGSFYEEHFDDDELPEEEVRGWADVEEDEDFDELGLSQDAIDLVHLGELRESFTFFGNEIEIRTLRIGEELVIGPLLKQFQGTMEEGRAYATAVVSACLDAVDGRPIARPVGKTLTTFELLKKKWVFVTGNYYWPTIRYIYERYLALLERQKQALEEVEKKALSATSPPSDSSES